MSDPVKAVPYEGSARPHHAAESGIAAADVEVSRLVADEPAASRSTLPLASLSGVLDTIDHGIVLLRSDAYPAFSNSAARRLLLADADSGALAREMRSVSRAALSSAARRSVEVEVDTRTGRYRMRATMLLEKIKEITNRAVLVTIERAPTELPAPESLVRRFGMTRREADVALLLARGVRNATIASQLRISPHTARHHTESVLSKLNVHSRAGVARALVEPTEPQPAPVR